jgi:hypothetical protein
VTLFLTWGRFGGGFYVPDEAKRCVPAVALTALILRKTANGFSAPASRRTFQASLTTLSGAVRRRRSGSYLACRLLIGERPTNFESISEAFGYQTLPQLGRAQVKW